ncbi:hypothetical protein DID75_05775 [Candidatus Marinamargulisbacteria bacterium SCGC AG-410-N11]|nr:hypothetical protein DID75_05775 [Candidatus Marinamargulisbacteria bacterium SCGC AG-410-N11]
MKYHHYFDRFEKRQHAKHIKTRLKLESRQNKYRYPTRSSSVASNHTRMLLITLLLGSYAINVNAQISSETSHSNLNSSDQPNKQLIRRSQVKQHNSIVHSSDVFLKAPPSVPKKANPSVTKRLRGLNDDLNCIKNNIACVDASKALDNYSTLEFNEIIRNIPKNVNHAFKQINNNKKVTEDTINGKSHVAYTLRMAIQESGCNPKIVNKFGFTGLFQFGPPAFKDIGITTENEIEKFKNTPILQIHGWWKFCQKTWHYLSHTLDNKFSTSIDNINWNTSKKFQVDSSVTDNQLKQLRSYFNDESIMRGSKITLKITKSGALAAAHLQGQANVARMLTQYNIKSLDFDETDTPLVKYFDGFGGYDIEKDILSYVEKLDDPLANKIPIPTNEWQQFTDEDSGLTVSFSKWTLKLVDKNGNDIAGTLEKAEIDHEFSREYIASYIRKNRPDQTQLNELATQINPPNDTYQIFEDPNSSVRIKYSKWNAMFVNSKEEEIPGTKTAKDYASNKEEFTSKDIAKLVISNYLENIITPTNEYQVFLDPENPKIKIEYSKWNVWLLNEKGEKIKEKNWKASENTEFTTNDIVSIIKELRNPKSKKPSTPAQNKDATASAASALTIAPAAIALSILNSFK